MRVEPKRVGWCVVAGLTAWVGLSIAAGCASPVLPNLPDGRVDLNEDEGLLVVHVDSDRRFDVIYLGPYELHGFSSNGELRVVRVKAGRHSFKSAEDTSRAGWRVVYDLSWMTGKTVDVRAGHVNYPGKLIIRHEDDDSKLYRARVVNRSSEALRSLRRSHPTLLRTLPVRYAGGHRDEFIETYLDLHRRMAASDEVADD